MIDWRDVLVLADDCCVPCHWGTAVLAHESSGRIANHASMASIDDSDSEFTSISILDAGATIKLH